MNIGIVCKEFNIDRVGMAVIPANPSHGNYVIEFEADAKIDYVEFKTCSRSITATDPKVVLNRKKYLVNYSPNELELVDCPVHLEAYNDKNMYSSGFVSFENPKYILPAKVICGEDTVGYNGSSVCQGRIGAIEKISFDVEVLTNPIKECALEGPQRGKEFIYRIKRGSCDYIFIETKPPYRKHKLDVFGWEKNQSIL